MQKVISILIALIASIALQSNLFAQNFGQPLGIKIGPFDVNTSNTEKEQLAFFGPLKFSVDRHFDSDGYGYVIYTKKDGEKESFFHFTQAGDIEYFQVTDPDIKVWFFGKTLYIGLGIRTVKRWAREMANTEVVEVGQKGIYKTYELRNKHMTESLSKFYVTTMYGLICEFYYDAVVY
ncbi:MAG: hypothetical protein SPI72_01455 [Porphyromonas sp.]|nr:hypothetical protein [Porphyromonas sp.]